MYFGAMLKPDNTIINDNFKDCIGWDSIEETEAELLYRGYLRVPAIVPEGIFSIWQDGQGNRVGIVDRPYEETILEIPENPRSSEPGNDFLPITPSDVKHGIARADWNLNFSAFCQLLGLRDNLQDDHSCEMWSAFRALSRSVGKFDSDNLGKLILYGINARLADGQLRIRRT
jgi:hypothetical protein